MPVLIIATIGAGLYLDAAFEWGQAVTNVWVWALFGCLLYRSGRTDRISLLLCLGFATFGEIMLSMVWGLYEYRLPGIPLFVFPGHCLLFSLGIWIAQRMPERIVPGVPLLALPWIAYAGWSGFDTEAILWFAVFLLCLKFGPAKKLYAVMFVLALIMEIYGTWMGNWRWVPVVPVLGLTSSNPPACAGVFYCLLDLIVTALVGRAPAPRERAVPAWEVER